MQSLKLVACILEFLSPDDWLRAWKAGLVNEEHFFALAGTKITDEHFICSLKTWMCTIPEGPFLKHFRKAMLFIPQLGISGDKLFWDFRSTKRFAAFLKLNLPAAHPLRVSVASEEAFMDLVALMQQHPKLQVSAMCVIKEPWPGKAEMSNSNICFDSIWIAYKLKKGWNHVNLCDKQQAWRYNKVWPLASRAVELYA